MSRQLAEEFIAALHALEERGDMEPLVSQYAEDATLDNLSLPEPLTGVPGARRFWEEYRALFREIRSEFSHVVVEGDEAALEWTSRGTLAATGEPFSYGGVTMLMFRDGKVAAFRGYFDQQALTTRLPGGG